MLMSSSLPFSKSRVILFCEFFATVFSKIEHCRDPGKNRNMKCVLNLCSKDFSVVCVCSSQFSSQFSIYSVMFLVCFDVTLVTLCHSM